MVRVQLRVLEQMIPELDVLFQYVHKCCMSWESVVTAITSHGKGWIFDYQILMDVSQHVFKLTNCKPNTANQNLRVYGIMLIVAVTTLLLIIVNCSDQAFSKREKKAAKSREAAARQARETAQARERWKAAKNVAKKGAFAGLQKQLSWTFSRRKIRSSTRAIEDSRYK